MINLQKMAVVSFTLVTLVLLLILHYRRHFSIAFSKVLQCKSCIIPQQEGVYFMPMSFTLYIIFEIILCMIIICRDTILITDKYVIMDEIVIYLVILLPVWEFWFNFNRFYSTYYASKKVVLLSNKQICIKFMYFGTTFIAIFLLQIHVDALYYLFPIIMAYYFIFNILCAWLFAHILIVQYRVVMYNSSYLTDIHDDMLQSVYFMRKISIIASINSSIFVALILINQGSAIVFYAPFLWNISTICLALNFVNNRHFLKHYQLTYYKAYLNCKISLNCNKPTKIHKKHISKPPIVAQSDTKIVCKTPLSAEIHTTHATIMEDECTTPDPVQPTLILTLNSGATSTPKSADRDPSISSNDKPKLWYQRGVVSIGTPGSETNTTNTPKDRLLNPQTSPEVLPNNRNRNNSNKALKMLGIQMYNGRVIRVPSTPIPGFLDHLYNQPKTSSAVLSVIKGSNELKLIPVSSRSELKMRPIAVQINDNNNTTSIKRKQSTPWYQPTFFQAEDDAKRQKNDKDKILKKNLKHVNFANFANNNIDEVDRKRARTLSVKTSSSRKTKMKNENEHQVHHMQADSVNLNASNAPKTPDIHVLDSFKNLAKHGLYSDANIASAEQLRNYTNRTMTI